MNPYFAAAPLKAYLVDILVWLSIVIPILFIIYVLLKRKPIFILIFGIVIILSAIPIAFMSELSISPCCGAPSNGREGLGYVIGAAVALAGALIIIFRNKLSNK